jgi:hypothetical protein
MFRPRITATENAARSRSFSGRRVITGDSQWYSRDIFSDDQRSLAGTRREPSGRSRSLDRPPRADRAGEAQAERTGPEAQRREPRAGGARARSTSPSAAVSARPCRVRCRGDRLHAGHPAARADARPAALDRVGGTFGTACPFSKCRGSTECRVPHRTGFAAPRALFPPMRRLPARRGLFGAAEPSKFANRCRGVRVVRAAFAWAFGSVLWGPSSPAGAPRQVLRTAGESSCSNRRRRPLSSVNC